MKILVISSGVPYPPISGGLLRTFHLMRTLAEEYDITLIAFTYGDQHESPPYRVNIVKVPWEQPKLYEELYSDNENISQAAYHKLDCEIDEPWLASYYQSSAMEHALENIAHDEFDLIIFEGTDMTRFLPMVPEETPKILDFMDLHSLMAQRALIGIEDHELRRAEREAERILQFEKSAASKCTMCLTCSKKETESAIKLLGATNINTLPNGVDTSYFMYEDKNTQEYNILFTGSFGYAPNSEAVRYFVNEIFPLILQELPHAIFHVVGVNPGPEVKQLGSDNVIVHGRVDDMRPFQQQAAVVVVPILHGGGTRLKVLEAAASGNAIVTTSLGSEGLEFVNGKDLYIADSSEEFSNAVITLLKDKEQRLKLGKNARKACLQYDWGNIGNDLRKYVDHILKKNYRLADV